MEVQFDINVFFSKMLAMFPAWRQAIPNPAFMQATIEAWGDVFDEEGVPNQEFLNNGLKRMAKASQSPFMPTPYQFLEHCYPTRTELGIRTQFTKGLAQSVTWHLACVAQSGRQVRPEERPDCGQEVATDLRSGC